jgi:hypothetical protein
LRLVLPRGRRGAGLGGLSAAPARAGAWAALAIALLSGCGSSPQRTARQSPPAPAVAAGPAFALTEDNANLLWSPSAAGVPAAAAAGTFRLAREQLSALHPAYVRLLIDWAALQPAADRPPDLEAQASGCARTLRPCAPYAGVRAQLEAIASQQRSGGGFTVVVVIFGTPAWAAQPPSGCERGGHGPFSRAPDAAGLLAYRALMHTLIALGAREGVALDWWAPWNEPNDPTFLAPQRSFCAPGAPARSPASYAALARATAAQLQEEGGERHILLGELNAYPNDSPDRVGMAGFVAALPADVLCAGAVWTLHAYAARGRFAPAAEPVAALEAALDARGGCARQARVWVTESGSGAAHPGDPRLGGEGDRTAGCLTLARQLQRWSRDPRVDAVFQYTFRDDPAFPVGLVDAQLSSDYPVYRLWLAWSRARVSGAPPQASAGACSG